MGSHRDGVSHARRHTRYSGFTQGGDTSPSNYWRQMSVYTVNARKHPLLAQCVEARRGGFRSGLMLCSHYSFLQTDSVYSLLLRCFVQQSVTQPLASMQKWALNRSSAVEVELCLHLLFPAASRPIRWCCTQANTSC